MSIYMTAMHRAEARIRRGDISGGAHWMTVASRSPRIDFRWHAQQLRREAQEDAHKARSRPP